MERPFAPGGLLTRLEADRAIKAVRDAQGRFAKTQNALNEAHRELINDFAIDIRRWLAEQIAAGAGSSHGPRAQRPTAFLVKAVGSYQNWRLLPGGQGFVFDPENYLNTAASGVQKYWRIQEEGYTGFLGRQLAFRGRGPGFTTLRDTTNMRENPRRKTVTVRNPIRGYRYITEGLTQIAAKKAAGRSTESAIGIYQNAFANWGIPLSSPRRRQGPLGGQQ